MIVVLGEALFLRPLLLLLLLSLGYIHFVLEAKQLAITMSSSSSYEQPQVITCKGKKTVYFLCLVLRDSYRNSTAAVAWRAGEPLVMEEVEVSPPQPLEIRIKVVCTSLCRSDLSAWESQVSYLFLHNNFLMSLSYNAFFLSCYSLFCHVSLAMKLQGKLLMVSRVKRLLLVQSL